MKQCLILSIFFLLIASGKINAQKGGQELIDSLLQELPKAKEDTNKVNLLDKISFAYYSIKPDEGIKYGQQGLGIADKLQWLKGIVMTSGNLSVIYKNKYDYLKAVDYYEIVLKVQEGLRNTRAIATINDSIGYLYNQQKDYFQALQYLQQALKIDTEQVKDKSAIAEVRGNIGYAYFRLGKYPEAFASYFDQLKIYEELGSKDGVAKVYGGIGAIYETQKEYSKALEYMQNAIKIFNETNNKNGIAGIIGNIGNVYNDQQDYSMALEYYKKKLKIDEELGNKDGNAGFIGNIAIVYAEQHNYKMAIAYEQKALKMAYELHDNGNAANDLDNIGEIFLAIVEDSSVVPMKKTADTVIPADMEFYSNAVPNTKDALLRNAIDSIQKGLLISKEIHEQKIMMECYQNLTEAYKQKGNYKAALENYERYITIRDSVHNSENKIKIWQTQMQYDNDKKEALRDKNEAIRIEKTKRRQIILAIVVCAFFIGSIYSLNAYRKRKLKNTRTELTSLARAKLHNIRSKYNNIYLLALEEKNNGNEQTIDSALISYIDKSGIYFKALLNGWKKEGWSIVDELNLLQKFYESEIVIKKPILIVTDFQNIEIDKTGFIQEVFTTLLDNSMAYAFPKVTRECVFKIIIRKEKNVLHFEISDNGEGGDVKQYRTDDPNDGLNVLDARIINAFQLAGWGRKNIRGISIFADKETGTTIKFDFPYAAVKNIDS